MMAPMATRTVGTRITEADHARLQDIAAALGKTPAAILREALGLYVETVLPLALLARRGSEAQGNRARRGGRHVQAPAERGPAR